MQIDANSVVNLPGLDNRAMNKLIAVRVACHVLGTPRSGRDVDQFIYHVAPWLDGAFNDADVLTRRYTLLACMEGRGGSGVAEQDVAKLVKLVDDVYRRF